jgi:Flp pilus assembly protein TadB
MSSSTAVKKARDPQRASDHINSSSVQTTEQSIISSDRDVYPSPLLGDELPTGISVSILAAYAWMAMSAWIAFGGSQEADLALSVMTLVIAMPFAITLIAFGVARSKVRKTLEDVEQFEDTFDTATGRLPAGAAWGQILLIPVALAVAATLIGLVHIFEAPTPVQLYPL